MKAVSNGMADLDYCEALSREVTETLGFLERNGVELIYFPQPFANRNTGGGLGMPAKGGVGIVDGLAAAVEAHARASTFSMRPRPCASASRTTAASTASSPAGATA